MHLAIGLHTHLVEATAPLVAVLHPAHALPAIIARKQRAELRAHACHSAEVGRPYSIHVTREGDTDIAKRSFEAAGYQTCWVD